MSAPAAAFQLPTDQEEYDELAKLTGLLQQPATDVLLDAVASDGLRVMAEEDREITRYRKALEAEIQRIYARYSSLIEPHEKIRASAEGIVAECAKRAQFVGKAKSRKVGNGTYGRRQVPETVKITDRAALIAWLENHYPAVVTTETEKVVAAKDVKPVVIQHMKLYEGEVAPGVEYAEAHDECFARPILSEETQ